ncbi:MAG: dinitrogenase iron-molybdenum cofactor [Thermoplasmata archaeon]|nr:MAG: dinitrogenase iron-molybdenum cofactor [Thermoplasmata archaeon]
MKIAVATNVGGENDTVSPVFGRTPTFTIVEVKDGEIVNVEVVSNTFVSAPGGAGIRAAELVANKGVKAVIAGNFGPNVFMVFGQAGIEAFIAHGITVREAVEKYLRGELQKFTPGTGTFFGGRGMGMGKGMRAFYTPPPPPATPPPTTPASPVNLEERISRLEKDIAEIKKMIKELKEK